MLVAKIVLRSIGIECITYEKATQKHVEVGLKFSPETICFCFKPMIGGLIECVEKGANTLFWFDSHGLCRARYYPMLQDLVLKKVGHEVDFFIFDGPGALKQMKELLNVGYVRVFERLLFAFRILKLIEKTEDKSFWYRPREKNKGDTDKALKKSLQLIEKIEKPKDIKKTWKEVKGLFDAIEIKPGDVPRIIVLGEIYLIHDTFANQDLSRHLGNLGFEVTTALNASEFFYHIFLHKFYHRKMVNVTKDYLGVDIGGHSRDSLMSLLLELKKRRLDGVVHVGPFGCMPEVTINPILQKVANDHGLPFIFLTFDAHTSSTGLLTRLEAFSDLIKWRNR